MCLVQTRNWMDIIYSHTLKWHQIGSKDDDDDDVDGLKGVNVCLRKWAWTLNSTSFSSNFSGKEFPSALNNWFCLSHGCERVLDISDKWKPQPPWHAHMDKRVFTDEPCQDRATVLRSVTSCLSPSLHSPYLSIIQLLCLWDQHKAWLVCIFDHNDYI